MKRGEEEKKGLPRNIGSHLFADSTFPVLQKGFRGSKDPGRGWRGAWADAPCCSLCEALKSSNSRRKLAPLAARNQKEKKDKKKHLLAFPKGSFPLMDDL